MTEKPFKQELESNTNLPRVSPQAKRELGQIHLLGMLLLILIFVITYWPFLLVGMVINDDIYFSYNILKNGPMGFVTTLWQLTLQYGRPQIFKVFSYFLPFIIGS
jgi:hypothetical protein